MLLTSLPTLKVNPVFDFLSNSLLTAYLSGDGNPFVSSNDDF
jgi:hypothetical protein